MRTREPSKAELQRIIKLQKKGAAILVEQRDDLDDKVKRQSIRIDDLKSKLDDAIGNIDIAREQRDKNAEELQQANVKMAQLQGELNTAERYRIKWFNECCRIEKERDRARAALVKASINTSRLVEAVEPRNMAATCN